MRSALNLIRRAAVTSRAVATVRPVAMAAPRPAAAAVRATGVLCARPAPAAPSRMMSMDSRNNSNNSPAVVDQDDDAVGGEEEYVPSGSLEEFLDARIAEATAQADIPGPEPAIPNAFTLRDLPGFVGVVLRKKFRTEDIVVRFTLDSNEGEMDMMQKLAQDSNQDPDSPQYGQDAPTDANGNPLDQNSFDRMVQFEVVISKGERSFAMDCTGGQGMLIVNNVSFFEDAKFAHGLNAESAWRREFAYKQPIFTEEDIENQRGKTGEDGESEGEADGNEVTPETMTLNMELQHHLIEFLSARGVDGALCAYMLAYRDYKAGKEEFDLLKRINEWVKAT